MMLKLIGFAGFLLLFSYNSGAQRVRLSAMIGNAVPGILC